MKLETGLLIFAFLFCSAFSFAQKNIKLQQLSIEDGLSQNTINTIFQDSSGFMWFGTQNGLNQYDGTTVTTFKNDVADSTSISSNDVYAVYEDRNKNIWFGTRAGLSRLNKKTNTFSNFDISAESPYSLRPAWCIIGSTKDDNLWIGASGGLFSFNTKTKKFNHYKIHDSSQNANSIRAICEDKKGIIWVGTSIGQLLQFDKSNKRFHSVNLKSEKTFGNYGITCMFEDTEGHIWLGREDGVIMQYDSLHQSFIYYNTIKDKFPIRTLLEDKEGSLWIGTDKGGVFLMDKISGKVESLSDKSAKGTDVVLSLYNDAKGDMWLGTYHAGAFLFDKMDTTFNYFYPYKEIKNQDDNNSILAIYQDENSLWIGTDGGGLVKKNKLGLQFYKKKENKNSIAGNTIMCITPGSNENLYMGTYANGLSEFDKRSGQFTHYNQENKTLNDNSVWTIYADGNMIWIGTNKGGLNLFDTKKKTFTYFTNNIKDEKSISSNTIRCILKDSRNRLWIGTVSGLNIFNKADSTFTSLHHRENKNSISNNNILCIYEDVKKNIWMGTHGGGLNKFDYRTNTFTSYQENDGLAGNIIYGILEDGTGNLWMSTNKGISRFDPEKKEFKNFDTNSSLPNSLYNVGAYFKNKQGEMFFGSVEGLCSFYPHHIRQNNYVPPIVITEFYLFNKPVAAASDGLLQKPLAETSEITLDHTQSIFGFKFAALNYSHAYKKKYAYKLEPFDTDWNYVENTANATYMNLDPGNYVFKVKGSNNDGVWNENYASVKLIITPPFWKTIWFIIMVSTLAAFSIYSLYQMNIKTIKKQKEILAHLVSKRSAEIEVQSKVLFEAERKNAQLIHQKLNDELAAKSKELTNYTLLIIQKNKLLDELKKKLKDAIRQPSTSNLRDFKNLIKLINYNFSPEKEWLEFNSNFNRVHEDFVPSLKSKFTELTNNDMRLCALYRIGIPTKDIAEAMGISQTSVKMARYRLRKKLGLKPEDDINDFLKTFS